MKIAPSTTKWRTRALAGGILASLGAVIAMDPIAQNPAYHDFADQRGLLGVPNLLDVASNIAFLVVGVLGIALCAGPRRPQQVASWTVFFLGVVLTAFGSAWYHLAPDNASLVWDRLPMTLAFMALFAALVAEHAGAGLERGLLVPALAVGVASVLWWGASGDLRFYLWVQFAPLLGIFFLLAAFPARQPYRRFVLLGLGLYGLAKASEIADKAIFTLTHHVVSGHTLKHLIAAGAIFALLVMLRARSAAAGPRAG